MKVSTGILRSMLNQEGLEGDLRDFLALLEKRRLLAVGPNADVQLGSKLA